MTSEEMKQLNVGDLIRHAGVSPHGLVVTGNYGNHITAVRTVDISNPIEWILVAKASHKFD